MRLTTKIFFLVFLLVGSPVIASEPATGPVIDNNGPVFAVPQGSYNLLPQVTMAVSAMTVHVRLQQEGYRAILF